MTTISVVLILVGAAGIVAYLLLGKERIVSETTAGIIGLGGLAGIILGVLVICAAPIVGIIAGRARSYRCPECRADFLAGKKVGDEDEPVEINCPSCGRTIEL